MQLQCFNTIWILPNFSSILIILPKDVIKQNLTHKHSFVQYRWNDSLRMLRQYCTYKHDYEYQIIHVLISRCFRMIDSQYIYTIAKTLFRNSQNVNISLSRLIDLVYAIIPQNRSTCWITTFVAAGTKYIYQRQIYDIPL